MSVFFALAAFAGGFFAAWVIGANSASPSFGPITSAGAVGIFRSSLIVGVSAFLGAVLQGGSVASTIGEELITGITIDALLSAIILLTASSLILGGIMFKYPMPTAFTLVGSVVGVGVAAEGIINTGQLSTILFIWFIIPFVAVSLSYAFSRILNKYIEKGENKSHLNMILIILGGYTAFTAGANQSGLVVGPLMGVLEIDIFYLLLFGGGGMVIGAWTASPKIIHAVSREYSILGPRRATASLLSASLIAHTATFIGVPVSFNETVIFSVIGSGLIGGLEDISYKKISRTIITWILAIIVSVVTSFSVAYIALNIL